MSYHDHFRLTVMGVGAIGLLMLGSQVSEAQRRGGGGGRGGGGSRGGGGMRSGGGGGARAPSTGGARMSGYGGNRTPRDGGGAARTSVNRDFSSPQINRTPTASTTNRDFGAGNRPAPGTAAGDRTRDVGRTGDVNRDRNVNRDVNRDVNRNYDLDYDVDGHWHPVARAAAWTAGAAITAAAIGSIVYSLPPSCTTTYVSTLSYYHCGSAWYQPQFAGTSVTYVVVQDPQ
jgi:hypothetical protein